jgi:DNA-binding transcriptional LysR family regulator
MSRTRIKLKGLSLDRLETLSGIVAAGGIMRAAGGDANRQSQFSRQVAELEAWFGVELLNRSSIPSKPTEAALRIVRQVDEFQREMDAVRESGGGGRRTVVFGAGERMIRSYLIPWAAKVRKENLKLVFRNLTSSAIRTELLARRLDFGILRSDACPEGFERIALKPIPMCFLLPSALAKGRKKSAWENLEEIPLALMEGEGRFIRFLREKALAAGILLDVAMECSTWTQAIDAMRECGLGGFLPKDLEKQFPAGFEAVSLPGLAGFSDEFVIAWSAAEAGKRPEIGRLAKRLVGSRS